MLKAGFARLDVTPPLGTFIPGAGIQRFSEKVLDPIFLNALAISLDGETVIVVAADFLAIGMQYANELRDVIAKRTGVPVKNIMIHALHQHSAIELRAPRATNNMMGDFTFLDVLYRKFSDVAFLAVNDLTECSLSTGIKETEETIAFIRRYYMKDGSIATNPIGKYQEVERRYADADNRVRLLRFKREGAKDIALVNFQTHPDVIHKNVTSADWPGFVRKFVEHEYLDEVDCLVTVGVQGDCNHCDFFLPEYKDGYGHSKHMGRVIANAVIAMWDKTEPVTVDSLISSMEIVYNKTRTEGEELYDEMKEMSKDKDGVIARDPSYTTYANMMRIVAIRESAPIYKKLPVSVINLGPVAFVGFGGEPFTQYGWNVRAACPDRFILTSCNTNGSEGYLVTTKAFSEGGYEASSTPFTPGLEEACCEAAVKQLNAK
ncbi:MAG: hypothetical protein E7609_02825 [Ruminococcaceae bacterium]|nr:hypothetical protein [Oscillospiraceae bacterium]